MKKTFVLILATLMILALASCKNEVPTDLTVEEYKTVEALKDISQAIGYDMYRDVEAGEYTIEELFQEEAIARFGGILWVLDANEDVFKIVIPDDFDYNLSYNAEKSDLSGTGKIVIDEIEEHGNDSRFSIDASYTGTVAYYSHEDDEENDPPRLLNDFQFSIKCSVVDTTTYDSEDHLLLDTFKMTGIVINGKKFKDVSWTYDYKTNINTIEYNGHIFSGEMPLPY